MKLRLSISLLFALLAACLPIYMLGGDPLPGRGKRSKIVNSPNNASLLCAMPAVWAYR